MPIPAGGTNFFPSVGVPWSPKLVNVKRARPRGAEFRLCAVVQRAVQISGVGLQPPDLGVVCVDDLARLRVGVADGLGGDRLFEFSIQTPHDGTGILNRLKRVPGHHDLRGGVCAELQVQASDRRRRHGVESFCGCGRGLGRPAGQQRRRDGCAGEARGGEQLSTADLRIEFFVGGVTHALRLGVDAGRGIELQKCDESEARPV
jgi:hypothetical protein